MTVDNFADGNILTGGSLNSVLNRRAAFYGIQAGATLSSGGSLTTVYDVYITSGNFYADGKAVCIVPFRLTSVQGTNTTCTIEVSMGASGTSYTPTTSGVYSICTQTQDVNDATPVFVLSGASWVNASLPTLVRVRGTQNNLNDAGALNPWIILQV